MLFSSSSSLVVLLFTTSVSAISEAFYNSTYQSTVDPFFFSGTQAQFTGKAGISINYWKYIAPAVNGKPSNALVICPGHNVPLRNFAELAYDLKSTGLSFYAIDHRGQGDSGRMIPDHQAQYVVNFQDYIDDLSTFYNLVVAPNNHPKKYILGDSMGGSIAGLYIYQNPTAFQGAILSSPMYGINTSPYPNWLAQDLAESAVFLGQGASLALGQSDWKVYDFSASRFTSSPARFYKAQSFEVNDATERLGGVTYQWLATVGSTMSTFLAQSGPLLPINTIMFQAGNETAVLPAAENQVCGSTSKCTMIMYPTSRHEILSEADSIRDVAIANIKTFLATH